MKTNHCIKYYYHIIILLVLFIPLILPLINAVTGNYSTTSPFSCGSNCSGSYELSGQTAEYCVANPVDCFNTIDSCKDGTSASLEYVENINITNLDETNFTGGDTISINAYIDCDSDGETVAFVYNNGSGFRNVNDTRCDTSARVNRYYNMTLDDVIGNHTVRVIIAYDGKNQMYNLTCGQDANNPQWSDTDDVTFYVTATADTINPTVSNPSPTEGETYEKQEDLEVDVCVDAYDASGIDSVYANITWAGGNSMLLLYEDTGNTYCDIFGNTEDVGTYNITFIVNDTQGNVNNTVTTYFIIELTTNITVYEPTHNDVFVYGQAISLNFTVGSGYDADAVYYSLDGGTNIIITEGKFNVSFAQSDANGTRAENTTAYANLSMSFIPGENMSVNLVSAKLKRNGSGTPNAVLQIRSGNASAPNSTILASGNITNTSVSTTNHTWINISLNTTVNLIENIIYWLFLTPNSSAPDFYYWESSDDGLYANGNYSNNASLDLLFIVYDIYKYRTHIYNISKGNHILTVYANHTTFNPIASPQINFTVDNSSPAINTINYTPNTSAQLDPDVTINFTTNVTDNVGVQQVILQYKEQNASAFQNITATNASSIYNASFTPNASGIWIARIFAKDTSNNTNTSNNITFNITYEYAWNITPVSFNTTSAFVNTNTTIGNITINNSADFTYTFNISKTASSTPRVYFNNTENSLLFNISPGSNSKITIITTGQSVESENDVSILINPLNSSASPDYLYTNFTFVSFISGVYLDIQIVEYDATVSQEQERVLLKARITNAGNETANNVSAIWSLPSGWTNKTNNTFNTSTLGAGEQVIFSRYFNIESDATTGNYTINVSVTSAEGESDTDSRNVIVSSSGEEETVVVTTGGGGGGGGIIPEKITKLEIDIVDEVEIERGANITLIGTLNNSGETDLTNLSIILKGFPLIHYNIKPDSLSELEANTSKSFALFINIPNYFGSRKHETKLAVDAYADTSNTLKKFSRELVIIVVTEDKANAFECFESAGQKISELQEIGIGTEKLSQKLTNARKSYNDKDYTDASNLCKEIIKNAELAALTKEQIASVNNKYSGLETDIPELSELIKLMQDAFEREDYELASRRAEQAELLLSLKEKEVQQTLSYRWEGIRKYLKEIIVAVVLLTIIGVFVQSSTSLKAVSKRIKSLDERHDVVDKRIKQAQEKYFVKKILPARVYEKEMEHHRSSLADIERKRNELKLKRLKIISGHPIQNLKKSQHEARESKKELQRKYFVDKSIDKKTFKKLMLGFDSILQDIDKRIALKEEKKEKKEKTKQ